MGYDKMFGSLEAKVSMQVDVNKGDRRNTIYNYIVFLINPHPHPSTPQKGMGVCKVKEREYKMGVVLSKLSLLKWV